MITKQGADNRQNGNYCLSITGWSPDYNDPMTFLDMWVTDGGNNDTRWGSVEYDALIDSATNETEDLAARQSTSTRLREILADQYIILPSYWRSASYTYNTNKILGGLRNTTFQTNFAYVEPLPPKREYFLRTEHRSITCYTQARARFCRKSAPRPAVFLPGNAGGMGKATSFPRAWGKRPQRPGLATALNQFG